MKNMIEFEGIEMDIYICFNGIETIITNKPRMNVVVNVRNYTTGEHKEVVLLWVADESEAKETEYMLISNYASEEYEAFRDACASTLPDFSELLVDEFPPTENVPMTWDEYEEYEESLDTFHKAADAPHLVEMDVLSAIEFVNEHPYASVKAEQDAAYKEFYELEDAETVLMHQIAELQERLESVRKDKAEAKIRKDNADETMNQFTDAWEYCGEIVSAETPKEKQKALCSALCNEVANDICSETEYGANNLSEERWGELWYHIVDHCVINDATREIILPTFVTYLDLMPSWIADKVK